MGLDSTLLYTALGTGRKTQFCGGSKIKRFVRKLSHYGMATLGTVLLLVMILVVLGFTLSASSVSHLYLNTHNLRETEARLLARSAVAAAVDEVFEDSTYGQNRDLSQDVGLKLQGTHPEAQGILSFSQARSSSLGVAFSTNNLDSANSVLGDQRTVSANSVHLVGSGTSGDVTRSVEAILKFTLFPQAIASSGPINSTGPLLVATLASDNTVSEEKLLAADILSNSAADPAIRLVTGTKVTGDVQSVGEISLPNDNTVDVWGEVRDHATAEDIVSLDPLEYDPLTLGLTPEELVADNYPGPLLLDGAVRASNNLTVDGDLVLNGGLFYVDGNLTVTGKLSGLGMLVTTGDVSVAQGSDFQSGQKVAILSKGHVSLRGTGRYSNFFQGLIYTQKGLSASQITIIGALINDASETDGVNLDGCRVFYNPGFAELTLETQTLPEVLTELSVTDYGYVVTVNPAEPPRLEYFRYEAGQEGFGPGIDPDEARRSIARNVQGKTPDVTFDIPQSLLDLTSSLPGNGGPGTTSGGYMGPGGSIPPGSGVVVDITNDLQELETFHESLIAPVASQLNSNHAEVMTGLVIRGFDRRDTSWLDGTGDITKVELKPSEVLKPNEHLRLIMWRED